MKRDSYSNLIETLEGELKIYRSLLEIVRQEKELLIKADVPGLNETNESKEKMILKLKSFERMREKFVKDLSAQLGVESEKPRLLELAAKMDERDAGRVRSIHAALDMIIRRVQDHNLYNEKLVNSALSNISGALNSLRDDLKESPTYKNEGKIDKKDLGSGKLVSREV